MRDKDGNTFRFVFVVMIVLILSVPAQIMVGAGGSEEKDQNVETDDDKLIELTDEEVEELGLNTRSGATRSEPWSTWERYSYHRGGESGLIAYQQSENRVFIYGGGSASWNNQGGYWSYSAYEDFFIYDFDTQKWYALEDCPPGGRFGFGSVIDEANERFIIYGGFSGSMLNDLWEFDMNTMTWSDITPGSGLLGASQNNRRAYTSMVLDTTGGAEDLYLLMGMEDDSTDRHPENKTDFYRIDLSNPSSVTPLNAGNAEGFLPRYYQSMCIDESGRRIYVFGGIHEDDGDDTYLEDFWVYDIPSNTWAELDTHPEMRMNIGAQIFFRNSDDKVYLWGGRENYTGSYYLDENETLWIYDTSLGSWDRHDYDNVGTDVPQGRLYYHHHYSAQADTFFVFGGRYYYSYGGYSRSSGYRDISSMDLSSKAWTLIPTLSNPSTNSDGIFAYEEDQGKLHYVGPSTSSGRVYTWYWDLEEEKWYGANYNDGTENPDSRSSAGMVYDPGNKTVYVYGGYYTTGSGFNRRYWNLDDMWKWDIPTNTWTNIWEHAGPGNRTGINMVWNSNDGSVYFFGGREYLPGGSSQSQAFGQFYQYRYGPTGGIFQEVAEQNDPANRPEKRYGAGTVFVPELNKMYLTGGKDPDPDGQKDFRDLWEFDFNTMKWTELDSLSSPMLNPKLDFDPLTNELYLTGGEDYVIKRYRILEDTWYSMDPDINPGSLSGQAHIFIPETRDLWIYGGGAKPGIWKIGMPYRLVIRDISFIDPEEGTGTGYSMLRPYHFSTTVRTVDGPSDLADVTMSFLHRTGTYKVIYNHTTDSWTESDPDDVAEVTSLTTNWVGKDMKMDVKVKFHWNFSSRPNAVDRKVSVSTTGVGVEPDFVERRSFLNIKNRIEIVDEVSMEAEIQGGISRGDWVQTFEGINLTGPMVKYVGTDTVFPPVDSYEMMFSEGRYEDNIDNLLLIEVYRTWTLDPVAGLPVEFNFDAPNRTRDNYTYILNVTGVYEEDEEQYKDYWLSVDGEAPGAPTSIMLHADDYDDTHTKYDNELEVYATWMSAGVSESGVLTHYWSLEDNGGTRDGTPVTGTEAVIELPSNGTHSVYVWTEDRVGNIGLADNASITIDTESPVFEIVRPDLDQMIPYRTLDIDVMVSDTGGSMLDTITIKYRYTNSGLNSEEMWTGPNAWNDLSELWSDDPEETMEFTFGLGSGGVPKLSDSEENFLQFMISDFAGNEIKSTTYNIRVDTDLRFPYVTLEGPNDGEVFDDPEDVELNWTLDFFLPEDVVYYLIVDKDRSKVENPNLDEAFEIVDTEYEPVFVTHGVWYWTVVPVARGEAGNSTNGIKSFEIYQEQSYSFTVDAENNKLLREKGKTGIPVVFNIENTGQNGASIECTADIEGIGSISWNGGSTIQVGVGEIKSKTALLDISEATPKGNYTLTFFFNSTDGVKRETQISLQVVDALEDDTEPGKEDDDMGLYLIMAAILVVLILLIVAVVYFMVIKKSDKDKPVRDDSDLDALEEEIAASGGEGVTPIAPQPQGVTSPKPSGVTTGTVEEGEEVAPPEPEEHATLAEEGSDDDWMNLVADETLALESQSGIEEDKTKHDEGKSLQDILGEMTADVDE